MKMPLKNFINQKKINILILTLISGLQFGYTTYDSLPPPSDSQYQPQPGIGNPATINTPGVLDAPEGGDRGQKSIDFPDSSPKSQKLERTQKLDSPEKVLDKLQKEQKTKKRPVQKN